MLSIAQQIYYKWDICHKKSMSDDSRFTGVLSESKVDLNPHQVAGQTHQKFHLLTICHVLHILLIINYLRFVISDFFSTFVRKI